jgi:L-fucose mutarotase/ribose pyranase (RbsD/FucU family)
MTDNKSINTRDIIDSVANTGEVGSISNSVNKMTTEEKKTLAEAAAEIQQLLDQLSQTYPTKTYVEKHAVATKAMKEIEQKPDVKGKVLKALKAGGVAALMELTNNPVVKILTPMLESLLEEG